MGLTEHFLDIPRECPKSLIVYGGSPRRRDFKAISIELFDKYVRSGSPYEITVMHPSVITEVADLILDDEWGLKDNAFDPLELYCIFDICLLELHSLLIPPFRRFRDSDSYKLLKESNTGLSSLPPLLPFSKFELGQKLISVNEIAEEEEL